MHHVSADGFTIIEVGPPAALPEVTVVAPSEPLPIHEVVVAPTGTKQLVGENLVFARIQRDEQSSVEFEVLPEEAPGPQLTPQAPFGTHRNVIEL